MYFKSWLEQVLIISLCIKFSVKYKYFKCFENENMVRNCMVRKLRAPDVIFYIYKVGQYFNFEF